MVGFCKHGDESYDTWEILRALKLLASQVRFCSTVRIPLSLIGYRILYVSKRFVYVFEITWQVLARQKIVL